MNDNMNPSVDPSPSDPEFILRVAMDLRSGGVTLILVNNAVGFMVIFEMSNSIDTI
jgi:hypothetical protein